MEKIFLNQCIATIIPQKLRYEQFIHDEDGKRSYRYDFFHFKFLLLFVTDVLKNGNMLNLLMNTVNI